MSNDGQEAGGATGGTGGALSLSQAHDAADEMAKSLFQESAPEPVAQEPPPAEAAPEATPEAQPQEAKPAEEAKPEAPAQEYEEFEYDGRQVRLSKADAHAVRLLGIRYLQEVRAREAQAQAQPEPAEPQVQPGAPEDPVQALRRELEEMKAERQAEKAAEKKAAVERARAAEQERCYTETKTALEGTPIYKEYAQNEKAVKVLQLFATGLQMADPNLTAKEAAKQTEAVFEEMWGQRQAKYVKGKVETGRNLVEGRGGAVATPTKPLGRKDLQNGRTEELAAAILSAANER